MRVKVIGFLWIFVVGLHGIMAQGLRWENHVLDSIFPVNFPLSINDFKKVSSGYGYRIHPIERRWKLHQGIDMVAQKGKPVYATGNGMVTKNGFENGYGNYVVLAHLQEIHTLYGHLWFSVVSEGDQVKRGQVIGFVGETGYVTGPHLHYEVWYGSKKLNPLEWWKSLAQRWKEMYEITKS